MYDAYQRKPEQWWYFVILFFPLIGSLAYLYVHFYNQRNVDLMADNIQRFVNKNHRIDELEREIKYSDTMHNRELLADEYARIGEHEHALEVYRSCLDDAYEEEDDLLKKLVLTSYYVEDFESAVGYGNRIKDQRFLESREEAIAYAWSLYHEGLIEKSESVFRKLDKRFCNYEHRLQYAHFLIQENRTEEAKQLLNVLLEEIDSMDRREQRLRLGVKKEILNVYYSL